MRDRGRGSAAGLDSFATIPVLLVAGVVVALLLVVSGGYGFHRDELYFIVAGRHPAFGYPDQPPLTPLLASASVALLGASPTAIRILPALAIGVIIVLTAAMTREMGGTRTAQVIGALAIAVSGLLVGGHLAFTATFDVLAWAIVLWLVVRLLAGGDPRWWLAVGVVAGIGLQNKHIPLFLGAGLAIGILLARRWDVVRSPWAWSAVVIAALIWLPNLAWQVANGMPQLEMAADIAQEADENRASLVPELLLLAGLFTFPIAVVGWWRLLRSGDALPWRPIGWAALFVLLVVIGSGGKSYYWVGFVAPLLAAGAVDVDLWVARGRTPLRAISLGAALLGSLVVSATLGLPIVPVESLADSPVMDIYEDAGEQVGWPELVSTVEGVVGELTPEERAAATIVTMNYGEAGALEVLGTDLPPVHSGHNGYWDWGPPREDLTYVLVVSQDSPAGGRGLGDCVRRATVDNGVGLDNEEQGVGVWACPAMERPWSEVWAAFRHLD